MDIKVTGLKKKTKAELVETVEVIQEAYQELKDLFEEEKQKFESSNSTSGIDKAEHEKALSEIKRLKEKLQKSDNTELKLKDLQLKLDELQSQNSDLLKSKSKNEQKLKSDQKQSSELFSKVELLEALKESLFDNALESLILVDAKYLVQFASTHALNKFQVENESDFIQCKIFDFFDYHNGMKLKKRIDKVFLDREKEKIKDLYCKSGSGDSVKIKGKIKPIQFKNLPAALIKLD